MKTFRFSISLSFFLFLSILVYGVTWDEPWQSEILEKSESFVLLRIDSVKETKGIWATRINEVAGKSIPEKLFIDQFYALRLVSISGNSGPEFRLHPDMDTAYFFLKKGDNGNFQMPTPTSGFAWRRQGMVSATYRISMQKAYASVETYEKSMAELFLLSKGGSFDKKYFKKVFKETLTQLPGTLEGTTDEQKLFFNQHIALECFYFYGQKKYISQIENFLKSDLFHNQISGIRALSNINTRKSKEKILTFILDDSRNDLARVLALDALRRLDAREYKEELRSFLPKASTKFVGFGLDIMDVRVGTKLPENLQLGIEELIEEWKS